MSETYGFTGVVYRWHERESDAWFFVDVPEEQSAEVRDQVRLPRGFGSVRVEVSVGGSTWRTSIFPGRDRYALPLKKSVRVDEGIEPGDEIAVSCTILE